jgi:hypothetical protein
VHLAPRLVHHVAREIRARPCPPAGYVLVGSRPLTLAAAAVEAWDGANVVAPVAGLSHAEISASRPDLSIEERLLRGGFPAVYADPEADVGEFMRALVADHLARELPLQLRVDSVHDFERFLRAAACRTGRLLNKAELAREIGIAGSTAAIWLDTLADAGVITLVQPWLPPHGKPLVKAPKLFFLDTLPRSGKPPSTPSSAGSWRRQLPRPSSPSGVTAPRRSISCCPPAAAWRSSMRRGASLPRRPPPAGSCGSATWSGQGR